jgi:hypothetical protein
MSRDYDDYSVARDVWFIAIFGVTVSMGFWVVGFVIASRGDSWPLALATAALVLGGILWLFYVAHLVNRNAHSIYEDKLAKAMEEIRDD